MQDEVSKSLDNAVANGYRLDEWEVAEIADDLVQYDAQFENTEPDALLPYIRRWQQSR